MLTKLRSDIKDWQIAQAMYGTNTKEQCNYVKKLRKRGVIEPMLDNNGQDIGYSIICDPTQDWMYKDEKHEMCGNIISNDLLE